MTYFTPALFEFVRKLREQSRWVMSTAELPIRAAGFGTEVRVNSDDLDMRGPNQRIEFPASCGALASLDHDRRLEQGAG